MSSDEHDSPALAIADLILVTDTLDFLIEETSLLDRGDRKNIQQAYSILIGLANAFTVEAGVEGGRVEAALRLGGTAVARGTATADRFERQRKEEE